MFYPYNPPPRRPRFFYFFLFMLVCSLIQMVPVFGVLMVLLETPLYHLTTALNAGYISQDEFSNTVAEMMTWWMDKPIITIATLFGTAGIVGMFILWQTAIRKCPLAEWGIRCSKKGVIQYALGMLLGLILFSSAVLFIYAMNAATLSLSLEVNWAYFVLFFFGFLIQGFEEEFLFRGFLMHIIKDRFSTFWAVLTSSLAFAFMHMSNEGMGFVAFINLTLFGVFASLLVLKTGNLWCAAALHSVWNFLQGNVFGCLVSGIDMGGGIFSYTPDTNRVLTNGGAFGPEGGLGVTLVLVIAIFGYIWTSLPSEKKKKAGFSS